MNNSSSFFSSHLRSLVILVILIAGLIVGLILTGQTQIFRPKADNQAVSFEGENVVSRGGKKVAVSPNVQIKLSSPFFAVPSTSSSASPTNPPGSISEADTMKLIQDNYGQTVPSGTRGDLTGDGVVDGRDFAKLYQLLHPAGTFLPPFLQLKRDYLSVVTDFLVRPVLAQANTTVANDPVRCAGFIQECRDPTGDLGSQWCEPGVLNRDNQCVFSYSVNSVCYKSQIDKTPGCLVSGVVATPSPSPPTSVPPSSSPTASGSVVPSSPVQTKGFKISQNRYDLDGQPLQPYPNHPTIIDYTFNNPKPGTPFTVFVRFYNIADMTSEVFQTSIDYVGSDPTIDNLNCSVDLASKGVVFTANGVGFGNSNGTIQAKYGLTTNLLSANPAVRSWKSNQITGFLANNSITDFAVTVTRADGVSSAPVKCVVGANSFQFKASVFCQQNWNTTTNNVELTFIDLETGGSKVKEIVSIDTEGFVSGIKTKLTPGRNYALAIKAPKSLKKVVNFTADDGTSVINDLILPVGDIWGPSGKGDGQINSIDYSKFRQDWSAGRDTTTTRTGDFNQDSRINSVDWACMRYGFGQSDEAEPAPGSGAPVPSGSPVSLPSGMPISSASPASSPTPVASIVVDGCGGIANIACSVGKKCVQSEPDGSNGPLPDAGGMCVVNTMPDAHYYFAPNPDGSEVLSLSANQPFKLRIDNLSLASGQNDDVALLVDGNAKYLGGPGAGVVGPPYVWDNQSGLPSGDHTIQLVGHCQYGGTNPDCTNADVKFNTVTISVPYYAAL